MIRAACARNVNANPVTAAAALEVIRRDRERHRRATLERHFARADIVAAIRVMLPQRRRAAAQRIARLRSSAEYRGEQRQAKIERFLCLRRPDPILLEKGHTLSGILALVCRCHGVTIEQMRGHRRALRIVLARKAYAYWSRELTGKSYPQIARMLDRDHTTILHGARTYRADRMKYRGML